MKKEERDTALLSVNISLKIISTKAFLTAESLSCFVPYNFHEVALWNSRKTYAYIHCFWDKLNKTGRTDSVKNWDN